MIYDYIVLGGGISGIYASYILSKKYNVLILEKNDYIGGRIKEVNFHDTLIKLGAGIGQCKNIHLLNLVKKLKIPYKVVSSMNNVLCRTSDFDMNNAVDMVKNKYNELKEENNEDIYNLNFGKFLIKYFGDKFYVNYMKYSGYYEHALQDISYHINYNSIDDAKFLETQKFFLKWGDLIEKLIIGLNYILNTNVINVIKETDGFTIITNNTTYKCKNVIYALTLKPLLLLTKNLNLDFDYNKYIGINTYLRIYTFHKNGHKFNNMGGSMNIIVCDNPVQKIITITYKIVMISYSDTDYAKYWNKMYHKLSKDDFYKLLLYWLRKIDSNITDIDDMYFVFWDQGVHYYKPLGNNNINSIINKLQKPCKNVYVVGEMVSLRHGWVDGAIGSVDNLFV